MFVDINGTATCDGSSVLTIFHKTDALRFEVHAEERKKFYRQFLVHTLASASNRNQFVSFGRTVEYVPPPPIMSI
jgi:hypothetical protein